MSANIHKESMTLSPKASLTEDPRYHTPLEFLLSRDQLVTGARIENGRQAMVYWFGSIANLDSGKNSKGIIAVRLRNRGPVTVVSEYFLGEMFEARLINQVWTMEGAATLDHSKRGGYWYKVEFNPARLRISE